MYLALRHQKKMVFFGMFDTVKEGLDEVVAQGRFDLSPGNIVDEKTKLYGTDFPKGVKLTVENIGQAKLIYLHIQLKEYKAPEE